MTIICTLFEKNEIYMVADAALTNSETGNLIKLNQLKLVKHPLLNAGISWYGRAKIDDKSTTIWLNDLISKNNKIKTISELANLIKEELTRMDFLQIIHSGFHISGFEKDGTPKFHHITNNHENDIVTPDVKKEFIDSGITPEKIQENSYVVNGAAFPFNVIVKSLKSIPGFDDVVKNMVDNIKYSLLKKGVIFNFELSNSPKGKLNNILFYLHIAQWFHLYSEQPDFIGGKYSTLIIHKNRPYPDYDPNGNIK